MRKRRHLHKRIFCIVASQNRELARDLVTVMTKGTSSAFPGGRSNVIKEW